MLWVLPLVAMGCVRSYQPLTGLHDPRVVDPSQPNLPGLVLDVYCVPGEGFKPAEASVLCQRVGQLFENQGADVETFTVDPRVQDGRAGIDGDDEAREAGLVVEIHSATVDRTVHVVSWGLCAFTGTLVPGVRERTFSQDIVVRGSDGYVLASRDLQGRIVESFGAGVWAGNKVLDWTVREKKERLTTESMGEDLSADLYGQLSQLVFNAKLRHQVLQERGSPIRRH